MRVDGVPVLRNLREERADDVAQRAEVLRVAAEPPLVAQRHEEKRGDPQLQQGSELLLARVPTFIMNRQQS